MRKVDAFLLALEKADQEVFLCTREKKVKPIQRADIASLFNQQIESHEQYADEIKDLFSNYLALNFSFVSSENLQNLDETSPQIDFDCITQLRDVFQNPAPQTKTLQKAFCEGTVSSSSSKSALIIAF